MVEKPIEENESKEKIVVIGLGFVGLPLACLFADAKKVQMVFGLDINEQTVNNINTKINPIPDEAGLDDRLKKAIVNKKLRAIYTDNSGIYNDEVNQIIKEATAIIICVDTPLKTIGRDGDKLNATIEKLAKSWKKIGKLKPKPLLIIESTLTPRTVDKMIIPKIKKATDGWKPEIDYLLAHCPERGTSGRFISNLVNIPHLIGGYQSKDSESTKRAVALYELIMPKNHVIATDHRTAEVTKCVENSYRDLNIAFANELALYCDKIGVNVYDVIELVNNIPEAPDIEGNIQNEKVTLDWMKILSDDFFKEDFLKDMSIDNLTPKKLHEIIQEGALRKLTHRRMLSPGPGVGGHCIPKDPWLLKLTDRYDGTPDHNSPGNALSIIPLARKMNDYMPKYVVDLVQTTFRKQKIEFKEAKVTILGLTFLENCSDTRNSQSIPIYALLKNLGAKVIVNDPLIKDINLGQFSYDSANKELNLELDSNKYVQPGDILHEEKDHILKNYLVQNLSDDFESVLEKSLSGATCAILVKGHREYKKEYFSTEDGLKKLIGLMREGREENAPVIIVDTCNLICPDPKDPEKYRKLQNAISSSNATYIGLGKGTSSNE